MRKLIRTAILNIPDTADVLFYYAGHGIQIGRRNYLLPVDAKFESIYDVPLATMTLDRVIDILSARSSAHVAILDSCRDNPFQDLRLAADLDAKPVRNPRGFRRVQNSIEFARRIFNVSGVRSPVTVLRVRTAHTLRPY